METLLEVKNLSKSYGNNLAVNNLSFDVYTGEILGLLGPNGAGKSTTITILSGLLSYNSGEIYFLGKDVQKNSKQVKANLGIVPQDIAFYEEISAYQNVKFFASLYGLTGNTLEERVKEALEFVGLEERKNEKPKTYSGGMKRRLNIACAIAHHPKLLILDEPTVGIDPQSRNRILDAIQTLRNQGTTVIYTTHYMEEIEQIADRVVIMDKGQKIAEGTIEELLEDYNNINLYCITLEEPIEDFLYLYDIPGVRQITTDKVKKRIKIETDKKADNLNKILSKLLEKGNHIQDMTTEKGNLEMVFLDLTGKKLRD